MTAAADFLTELLALCIKHDVHIGGCGCCGSPWVMEATSSLILGDALTVRPRMETKDNKQVRTYTDNTASLRLDMDTALTVRIYEDGTALARVEGDDDGVAP